MAPTVGVMMSNDANPHTPMAVRDDTGNSGMQSAVNCGHAFDFVSRVERRFADDPETVRAFLAILRKALDEECAVEAEVEHAVAELFSRYGNGNADLIDEFGLFVPAEWLGMLQSSDLLAQMGADLDQLDAAVRTELDGEAPNGAAPGCHVGDHISVIGLAGSRSHRTVLALKGAVAPTRTR